MSHIHWLFSRFPRITVFRVVLVGLVVWALSIGVGLCTDTASLPRFASHWSPWAIALMRKLPASFPMLWLAITGCFARWQMKRLPPAPPPTQYPVMPLLSYDQLRTHSGEEMKKKASFPEVRKEEERAFV